MALYINQVILLGTVGNDAEERKAAGKNQKIAFFSLATSKGGYTDPSGKEIPKVTEWHKIKCWNVNADKALKFAKKGQRVCVMGYLHYEQFEKDDRKHFMSYVVASDIIPCYRGVENIAEEMAAKEVANAVVENLDANSDLPF